MGGCSNCIQSLFVSSFVDSLICFLLFFPTLTFVLNFPGWRGTWKQWKYSQKYCTTQIISRETMFCFGSLLAVSAWDVFIQLYVKSLRTAGGVGSVTDGDVQIENLTAADDSTVLERLSTFFWPEKYSYRGVEAEPGVFSGEFQIVALAAVLLTDFHFYATHRVLHEVSWLYKHVHKVHHGSILKLKEF
jgi:sterol desaturase/sphingolipid hydroxylase (fatty acid hydroxylase superfamily)